MDGKIHASLNLQVDVVMKSLEVDDNWGNTSGSRQCRSRNTDWLDRPIGVVGGSFDDGDCGTGGLSGSNSGGDYGTGGLDRSCIRRVCSGGLGQWACEKLDVSTECRLRLLGVMAVDGTVIFQSEIADMPADVFVNTLVFEWVERRQHHVFGPGSMSLD